MPGRKTKPIRLHLLEGNPNDITKAEIERRLAAEVHIGSQHLTEPERIKNDPVAHARWMEIIKMRKTTEADWLTSADIPLLEMVCDNASELAALKDLRNKIYEQKQKNPLSAKNISRKITIDSQLNKKRALNHKLLDAIYWTPPSRLANTGKRRPKEKETELERKGFEFV